MKNHVTTECHPVLPGPYGIGKGRLAGSFAWILLERLGWPWALLLSDYYAYVKERAIKSGRIRRGMVGVFCETVYRCMWDPKWDVM